MQNFRKNRSFPLWNASVAIFFFLCTAPVFATDVELAWYPNTEPDLAGYKVYYGAASRTYETSIIVGNITAYTVRGLRPGTHYFAIAAYNTSGQESQYSDEVSTTLACTYSLSLTSQSFTDASGTGTVAVAAPDGCSWTATSNAGWITISSGSSGSGNGTINYSVAANTTTSRTGTLTIAGHTFTVTQAGSLCTYSLSPTSQFFTDASGTGTVAVAAPGDCSWTVTSNAGWISISSEGSRKGNGAVNYSVAPNNTSSSRTGALTIAGQIFTVVQARARYTGSFPQFANGDRWVSSVVLTNPSQTERASGSLTFLNHQGHPLDVSVNNQPPANRVSFTIEPLGSATFSTNGSGSLVAGSVHLSADAPVAGVVLYSHPSLGTAGVGESIPLRALTTFVVRDERRGLNTGLALSNMQATDATVMLSLRGLDGHEAPGGSASVTIPPGSLAKFIDQLFPNVDTVNFQGTLLATTASEDRITATALLMGSASGEFTALPVVAVDPPPTGTQLFFAQFVSGSNWTSSLHLANPMNRTSSGELRFFDDDGNPLAISVTGQALSAGIPLNIQPQGGAVLTTNGGTVLVAGSARVTFSDRVGGGVLIFASPGLGFAGVGASVPMTGFITPVRISVAAKFSTGVAIASIGSAVRVTLTLRNQNGQLVPGGQTTLDLRANGHLARFLEQLFPDADTREFQGTLTATAEGGNLVGTAIQIGDREGITTLPVTALR